jgi:hypothetical protein
VIGGLVIVVIVQTCSCSRGMARRDASEDAVPIRVRFRETSVEKDGSMYVEKDGSMYLVQVFLPLYDNANAQTPREYFHAVREELTNQFGGLTGYTRAPVEGLWKDNGGPTKRDDLVVYEVMVNDLDRNWWHGYRRSLETQFRQEQIVVRAQSIETL